MSRRKDNSREREHRYDRAIASAFYRRERARKGLGFKFEIPASARKAAT
jgi:hypothetical protein